MKIRQNVRHWASKKALTVPVIGRLVRGKLVDFHTDYFLDLADEGDREQRREHLEAFFDASMDAYLAALEAGYPEAEAREITHVQANFDFYNHGWTEMMEIPADELEAHYERYEPFFSKHGITVADPLGKFGDEIPDAPATPRKLDDPEHPHAEGGFADDVYVETGEGEIVIGGTGEPDDVSPSDAPGAPDDDEE